ncbi:MAG: glutamate-5-semialdehyde dehydrogenase [Lachnospiraceae bacterium]|nr:glutamate-5-semialdehyde dehydrogenase [Lachnospiraceae bacterium]
METLSVKEAAKRMKADSPKMAALSLEKRNSILKSVKEALLADKEEIFKANLKDLEEAKKSSIPDSVMKRLKFDEKKLLDVCAGIDQLITLQDPLGKVQLNRELDEGLVLKRVTCPIGVIGVIFEARPDALVQISSLCIKSGNCAVLKGGKETQNTNKALFDVIYKAAVENGAPAGALFRIEGHADVNELLTCEKYVDLLIPRGSNAFVSYIMNNTKIPVMGHADGVCHTYADKDADLEKAKKIIVDAKTQYTAACNATETLLISRERKDLVLPLLTALKDAGVKIRCTSEVNALLPKDFGAELMEEDKFNTEYLDMCISVKLVADVYEAADHINTYGSHHTDCIITENDETAETFMMLVDSAGTYKNCSTRFADGFRYGFGAEVGISTGKIHARGPVGLEGLTTYKYKLYGNGHIVGDYAAGRKEFHFKELE